MTFVGNTRKETEIARRIIAEAQNFNLYADADMEVQDGLPSSAGRKARLLPYLLW